MKYSSDYQLLERSQVQVLNTVLIAVWLSHTFRHLVDVSYGRLADQEAGEAPMMAGIRQEVATVMQAAAAAAEDDGDNGQQDFEDYAPSPAAARFAAAVQVQCRPCSYT